MKITDDILDSLIKKIVAQQEEIWRLEEFDIQPILREGASQQTLKNVKTALRIELPKYYEMFLSLHDGCENFSNSFDLLGSYEILSPKYEKKNSEFRRSGIEYGDSIVIEGIVIGYSKETNTYVLFDRTAEPDEEGELPVVVWEFGEVSRSQNFYRFLEFRSEVNDITIKNLKALISGGDIEE